MLPVLLTSNKNDVAAGAARFCVPGLKLAVTPWVDGIVKSAVSLASIEVSVCEVAVAVRASVPASAKLAAVVVMSIVCECARVQCYRLCGEA